MNLDPEPLTITHGDFQITTDRARIDVDFVHGWISQFSYWAKGIPRETMRRAIEHSLSFGLFHRTRPIGFARTVTDYATFAYLADVFVLEDYRGQGLGVWLVETVMNHPSLQGLRRWMLGTKDAHELYKKFGWKELADPSRFLEKHDPDVYR